MHPIAVVSRWLQPVCLMGMVFITAVGFCLAPAQAESWIAAIYENIAQT